MGAWSALKYGTSDHELFCNRFAGAKTNRCQCAPTIAVFRLPKSSGCAVSQQPVESGTVNFFELSFAQLLRPFGGMHNGIAKEAVPKIKAIFAKSWLDQARPGWWIQDAQGNWENGVN